MTSPEPSDLALANKILYMHSVLDAYGHVSVRNEHDPDRFHLSRNMAPALVESNDIQTFSLAGATKDARPSYLERFIHSEIYRARPDVGAVVHTHASSLLPFSLVPDGLKAVSHMAGFLVHGAPIFEVRDIFGAETDLLVRNESLGASLAECLGDAAVCLMRGHGAVVVGTTLPQAVHRAVFTVMNARAQREALQISPAITTLSFEEGVAAAASNDTQIERAWDFWRERVSR